MRASVDGFHHPAARRHRRGRGSPEGFYRDSYDYPAMRRLLLDPFRDGEPFRRGVHDVHLEQPVHSPYERAGASAVLLVDGIFVHRPELRGYWDLSVWLEVPFEVSVPRGAQRGYGDPDPAAASNRRYVEGQRLYDAECDPAGWRPWSSTTPTWRRRTSSTRRPRGRGDVPP